MPIITVSGPAGSGKTTYAKKLAQHLDLQYLAAGSIFRQIARKMGKTLAELSGECEGAHEIDRQIDEQIKKKAARGNVVADGRLTGYILKDLADLKIYVTASPQTRITRIMKRDGVSESHAKEETLARDRSEKKRFKEIYHINIDDLSIYDLILNTDKWSEKAIIQLLLYAVDSRKQLPNEH
ncbi:MAG: (d)CMP kinase [Candidatus Heimdallarchaeota archaeon]